MRSVIGKLSVNFNTCSSMETDFFESNNCEISDTELVLYCDNFENGKRKSTDEFENEEGDRKRMKNEIEKVLDSCIICQNSECLLLMFKPCEHVSVCQVCGSDMDKCPVCRVEIVSKIGGISSTYDINSDILENQFLFGRAIFTADQSDVFTKNRNDFRRSINKNNDTDKHHMWFPYFCHQLPRNESFDYPQNITGIIILEGLHKFGIAQLQCYPIGILVLKCPRYIRKSIILHGFVTKADFNQKICDILWFSKEDLIRFGNHIEKEKSFTWEELILMGKKLIQSPGYGSCQLIHALCHDTSECSAIFHNWIERTGFLNSSIFHIAHDGKDGKHSLTQLERLWLAVHVYFRLNKQFMLHGQLFTKLLECITITADVIEPYFIVDKINHTEAVRCTALSAQNNTTNQLIQAFEYATKVFNSNVKMYTQKIGKPIDDIFHEYAHFNIFIGQEVDNTIRKCISDAPSNLFDHKSVSKWCNQTNQHLVEKYSSDTFYQHIYSAMTCVENESRPFQLYDMTAENVNSFSQKVYQVKKSRGYAVAKTHFHSRVSRYKVVTGTFSQMSKYVSKSLTIDDSFRNEVMKAKLAQKLSASRELRPTQIKLHQAAITRTPIWCYHANGQFDYHSLVPDTKGNSLTDIMNKYIYPAKGVNMYSHEIVNPYLHVSTIILDIDIKPCQGIKPIPIVKFIQDLIHLVKLILHQVDLSNRCTHYIFQSTSQSYTEDNDDDDDHHKFIGNLQKYGFHYHIRLPHDTVFEVEACADLIKVLNDVRFKYKETLAIPVAGDNQDIFDSAIYKKNSFHLIRGGDQCKEDGSSQLRCIYSSNNDIDLDDVPLLHKFVHSPHVDPETNQYVPYGRVISKFINIKLVSDEVYLKHLGEHTINMYAKKACETSIYNIMRELNKKCILFTENPAKPDIQRLELMANELWREARTHLIKRMTTEKCGEADYTNEEIQLVKQSLVQINNSSNQLSLCFVDRYYKYRNFKLPFCLMRAHRNPVTNTITWFGFNQNMIHLNLFISCFKQSCQGKRMMPCGHLKLQYPFYAPHIEESFSRYLRVLCMNDPKIFEVCKNKQEYICNYINTNNTSIHNYISHKYDVQQLYIFIEDLHGYVMMCVTKRMNYLFVIMPHDLATRNVFGTDSFKKDTSQKCEVYVYFKDPNSLLRYLHDNNRISESLFNSVCSLLDGFNQGTK